MKPSSPYRTPSPPPSPPQPPADCGGGILVAVMGVLYAAALLGTGNAIVSTGLALIMAAITVGAVGLDDRSSGGERRSAP